MTRPRYGAHRDANQADDVESLRALGFQVWDFSQWLPWADLFIWGWDATRQEMRGTWWEWKTATGELTDTQKQFIAAHPGLVHQGRCVEDVLEEYGRRLT